ncbi:hypothetical protein M9Y10_042041 [Tritrichomonas musculus]|uniref:Uncharacterized protein n=1 Tax=Tritrichomonas musculus TaxID=1915356 RepID=A0ABR2K7U9_9EUKA
MLIVIQSARRSNQSQNNSVQEAGGSFKVKIAKTLTLNNKKESSRSQSFMSLNALINNNVGINNNTNNTNNTKSEQPLSFDEQLDKCRYSINDQIAVFYKTAEGLNQLKKNMLNYVIFINRFYCLFAFIKIIFKNINCILNLE